jgi:hypothetical protein
MDGMENIILSEKPGPKDQKSYVLPSYVDIRSRANTTMRLDFEPMIKARAYREG